MHQNRNISLDYMRFLCLLLIILAHSEPPDWLFQLRNFDVPLLIIVSGATHAFIYKNRDLLPFSFWKKRLPRLIFPAWIFLSFLFLLGFAVSVLFGKEYPWTAKEIITSYALYNGIGYVWIFRIYVVLALITPVSIYLSKRVTNNRVFFISLLGAYGLYELMLYIAHSYVIWPDNLPIDISSVADNLVFTVIPYMLLFLYGTKMDSISNRNICLISLCSFVIFAICAFVLYSDSGSFVPTQNYKYPPQLYYLSYALFSIHLVYLIVKKTAKYMSLKIAVWLSSHSLWIYLWHIFAIYIWDLVFESPNGRLLICLGGSVFILSVAVAVTYVQATFIRNLQSKYSNSAFIQKVLVLLV